MKDVGLGENATSFCEEQWLWNTTGRLYKIIGYCLFLIPVLAVVINIAEAMLVIKAPRLKLHLKIFLISLAFCDIFIGITVMPFRILGIVTDNVLMFGETGCDIGNSLEVMLTSSSVWHTCVLALDRCIASSRPFQLDYWFGKRNACLILTTCWVFPAVLAFGLIIPKFNILGIEREYKCINELSTSCQYITNTYYSIVHVLFALLVPSVIIYICNRRTISAIVRRQRVFFKLANIRTERGSFNRRFFGTTLSRTILTMTSVSFIFWLPLFTLFVVDPFISHKTPRIVWTLLSWLCYVRSAVSPVLYMKGTKVFRFMPFFMS